MTTTLSGSEHASFAITEEIQVGASLEATFASLLAQMGRLNETPDGKPLPMVIEPRPCGAGAPTRSPSRSASSRCTLPIRGNVAQLAAPDVIPEPPRFVQPVAATAAELVPALTASLAQAHDVLAGFDDDAMLRTWRLQSLQSFIPA